MSGSSKKGIRRVLFPLVILISLAAFLFWRTEPCRQEITYRLGDVDERFGLTREEFSNAVYMAAQMWGEPLSRQLFREDEKGVIEVRLVYDYRQEATDRLRKLNYKIERTKSSYDELKIRLENLKDEYYQKNAALTSDFDSYNKRVKAFNEENQSWRRRGGAPQANYQKIMNEKELLASVRDDLLTRQEEMKQMAETINSITLVVNEIAASHNLDLVDHQNTGKDLGAEFCEGYYEYKKGRQSITIYQYDNEYRLVRVLAHELGHALGLKHSEDKNAVMYRLIQSDDIELSPDDIRALKKRCGID